MMVALFIAMPMTEGLIGKRICIPGQFTGSVTVASAKIFEETWLLQFRTQQGEVRDASLTAAEAECSKSGGNADSMTSPLRLEFPIAKAEYLLTHATELGEGGDKQNFWRYEMGFESAEAIRDAVLTEVSIDMLQLQGQNDFGNLYRAYIRITGASGLSRRIRTVWIVRFDEDVAKFVTAVPDRLGSL